MFMCIYIYIYMYTCAHACTCAYISLHMCIYTYTYVYIYIYTRVFPCASAHREVPCASAHREARWNWSEVATMVSGYDPKVLSQELSHILSQTLSQMSYNFDRSAQKKKKNTVALPKSGY